MQMKMGKAVAISAILVADHNKIRISAATVELSLPFARTCCDTSGRDARSRIPSIQTQLTVDSVKFL